MNLRVWKLLLISISLGKMLVLLDELRMGYPGFSVRRRLMKRYKGFSGMKIACASHWQPALCQQWALSLLQKDIELPWKLSNGT
ncbi:hypothetical protein K440DRAFT_625582 [Wilcoxina mikolae CBS 423.85]|nr:hypothetical protein K440DRAFT_625582 [Wilcoxina mikolae CBS 423.85]